MKKIGTYSISMLIAALIFYGGAGVNMISYCCNLCRAGGIEVVINDKCCDIHHHQHTNNKQATSPYSFHEHEAGSCCNMNRISFDLSAQSLLKQEFDFKPVALQLFSCNLTGIFSANLLQDNNIIAYAPHGPPLVLPSDYLSILTVLLI